MKMYDDDLEGFSVVGGRLVELEYGVEKYYDEIEHDAQEHVPFWEEEDSP